MRPSVNGNYPVLVAVNQPSELTYVVANLGRWQAIRRQWDHRRRLRLQGGLDGSVLEERERIGGLVWADNLVTWISPVWIWSECLVWIVWLETKKKMGIYYSSQDSGLEILNSKEIGSFSCPYSSSPQSLWVLESHCVQFSFIFSVRIERHSKSPFNILYLKLKPLRFNRVQRYHK